MQTLCPLSSLLPRPILQVLGDDVGHCVDELGVVVRGRAPGHLLGADLLAQLVGVLDVQLVKGLDVLVHERDGHQQQVAVAALHKD